jgi:hypothetical protein
MAADGMAAFTATKGMYNAARFDVQCHTPISG